MNEPASTDRATAPAYAPDGAPAAGWIGVDLDGTLAEYHGWAPELGRPVAAMVARVKAWRAAGGEVRIVTARASVDDPVHLATQVALIEAWCLEHIGEVLPVTCRKDLAMVELWDDRAVTVEENTGRVIRHPAGEPVVDFDLIRRACSDPGAFVKRESTDHGGEGWPQGVEYEPLHVWQARAVVAALDGGEQHGA